MASLLAPAVPQVEPVAGMFRSGGTRLVILFPDRLAVVAVAGRNPGSIWLWVLLAVGGFVTWLRLRGISASIGSALGSAGSTAGSAIGDVFGWMAQGIFGTGSIVVLDILSMFFSGMLAAEGKIPANSTVVPPAYGSEFYEWREGAIFKVNMATAPAQFSYDDRIDPSIAATIWSVLNEAYNLSLPNPFEG